MSSSRGSKGSIRDRLISLLYRIRYAKKTKKEEEYEILKKEKQVEYLKKLLELQENNNINLLDESDKNILDKVKFNVNIKFNENININEKPLKIQRKKEIFNNIKDVDFELNNIESKTSELDEKVEIKKEIKKTKNELVILTEVENFINYNKKCLETLSFEVQLLKKISKDKNQNPKGLEEKYKKIREKIEKLKKQYDAIKEKYDLSEFSVLESIKLMDNIKEYKDRASLNELDMMINVCKKQIDKIEDIKIEYKEIKKVGTNIEDIKDKQVKIKIKFVKSKEDIEGINKIEKDIDYILKQQQKIVDEMYKEASYFERILKTKTIFIKKEGLLSSLLRIAGGILTLPFSGSNIFGAAFGNTLINRGLKALNNRFETKKEQYYEYKYTDITYKINETRDKLEYTSIMIDDNLNQIIKLKNNFKKYMEYNKILPEYDSTLDKLSKLEKNLQIQQSKILNINKKVMEEKELNEEKMQKVLKKESKKVN